MTRKISRRLHWERFEDLLMYSFLANTVGHEDVCDEARDRWDAYRWSSSLKGQRRLTLEQRAANREQWAFDGHCRY